MLSSLILIACFMFMMSSHPITSIIIIIAMTSTAATLVTSLYSSSWISYMFLLMVISGLMVMFIYMASLLPNSKLTSTPQSKTTITIMSALIMATVSNLLLQKPQIYPNNLYSILSTHSFYWVMMFLLVYLLLTLVSVMIMITSTENPMRQM